MPEALLTTELSLPNRRRGKVRDLYDVTLPDGEAGVLIVATDRISAFDVVMSNGLPGKGIVLTQLSRFWFEYFGDRIRHHLVSTDVADVPGLSEAERRQLAGRIMLCRKTQVLPLECIARGYLAGSGFKDYRDRGEVCGIPLPSGLRNGDRLPEPLFTPSTKAETGHDENIGLEEAAGLIGAERLEWLRRTTLALYREASDYARDRGIILADTKLEFGVLEEGGGTAEPILIDEIFTPDSSRFWPADQWQPGREQPSFDKQYVRDHLERLVAEGGWDRRPPGPVLPEEVVENTMARYRQAYERITGAPIELERD